MSVKSFVKKILPEPVRTIIRKVRSPFFKLSANLKTKSLILKTHRHYKKIEKQLKNRGDRPVRFACYLMYAADFGESEIFSLMTQNKDFAPKIVVIPDVARGKEHMLKIYHETKEYVFNKFRPEYVLDGYDEKTDTYYDYSDDFDIIAMNCPYGEMAHKYHKIEYLCQKNVLLTYGLYAFLSLNYHAKHIFPRLEFSLLWKCFLDTDFSLADCKKTSIYHGKNAMVIGYSKMDALAKCEKKERTRKRIIISPHHTINHPSLPLSNFMAYHNLILELPDIFPDVDFIFRPHPLLFTNLINMGFWTEEKVNEYIKKLEDKGVLYSHGGDYFDLFLNSDAIIHDCGSYITEWLFTGKPCCFVAKDDSIFSFFAPLGLECIKHYTVAYTREQIIQFIENVISGKNTKSYMDDEVLKEMVFKNYPNTSQKIVDYLSFR